MEDIAIVAFAQTPSYRRYPDSEPALLMGLVNAVLAETGLERREIDFTIAGSCDYLSGMPFAFISNVDAFGAWPPVYESHVEMDGAWALFEGFVRMQLGDIDTCLVAGSGKSSPGRPREIFPLQGDPYYHAPLGLDPVSMAGIQAQCLLDVRQGQRARLRGGGVAQPPRRAREPLSRRSPRDVSPDELLKEPYYASPLRRHDLPPISDGAAVVLLARGARARALTQHAGVDPRHRPPHGEPPPGPARPHRVCRVSDRREEARDPRRADRPRRALRALQPRGDRAARGARPRPATRGSTRRAGRSAGIP